MSTKQHEFKLKHWHFVLFYFQIKSKHRGGVCNIKKHISSSSESQVSYRHRPSKHQGRWEQEEKMLMRYKSPQIKVAILRVRRACIRVIFVLNCYFKVLVCWKIVDAFIFMSWNYNKNWRKCSQILGTHFKSQSEVCVLCILVLRVYVHVWRCLGWGGIIQFQHYMLCGSIQKSTFYRIDWDEILFS